MTNQSFTVNAARDEVTAHSAGGAPFLLAYGLTFVLTAALALRVSVETAGLIAMFQGAVALPLALLLERRMGWQHMSADNPLRTLSAQLAMSQALMLPALIVVYNIEPKLLPLLLAAFGGMHFVPYAWLHRTRLYIFLGGALAIGSFLLLLQLQTQAYAPTLAFIGLLYLASAPFAYRHAAHLIKRSTKLIDQQ